ncbi:MAG: hypothetical protein ACHQWU_07640, partial [Gemmatimonadales bacterium]
GWFRGEHLPTIESLTAVEAAEPLPAGALTGLLLKEHTARRANPAAHATDPIARALAQDMLMLVADDRRETFQNMFSAWYMYATGYHPDSWETRFPTATEANPVGGSWTARVVRPVLGEPGKARAETRQLDPEVAAILDRDLKATADALFDPAASLAKLRYVAYPDGRRLLNGPNSERVI